MSERSVEIPWAIRNAVAPVLDVGCAESTYLPDLPQPVEGIDVRGGRPDDLAALHVGDIRRWAGGERYATVLAISTVEHVGLEHGPYGTEEDDPERGDAEAVKGCWRHVAPGGKLLVSVPFGAPRNYGWFRQYDLEGLVRLFGGLRFAVEVWVRNANDPWSEVESLDEIHPVEKLEYDFDAGSARAVALVTIGKPR